MSLNIQTATGLVEIGGKVTQEKIESALGYLPVKPEDLSTHIEDNSVHLSEDEKLFVENKDYYSLNNRPNIQESGNDDELVVVDKNDIPILKVNKDGLTTAAIHLNGIEDDVATEINNLKQTSLKNIIDDESAEFIIVDKNSIPIFKINKDGVRTTDVVTNTGSINTSIENIQNEINKFDFIDVSNDDKFIIVDKNSIPILKIDSEGLETTAVKAYDIDASISLKVNNLDVGSHITNEEIHITSEERNSWNAKASMNEVKSEITTQIGNLIDGAPENLDTLNELAAALNDDEDFANTVLNKITNLEKLKEEIISDSEEFIIKDENDKIAFKIDKEGVTQAATFISNSISSNSLLVDGTDVNSELIELNDSIDTLNGDVTKVGSVSKKIADAISAENLSQYAKNDDLNKHINESDNRTTKLHITKAERDSWNAKSGFSGSYNDLKDKPENLVTTDVFNAHTTNTTVHITSEERNSWNAKSDFSGDYNDLDNAPNITEDGSGDLVISDPQGNIIFKSDGAGFETTTITAQSMMLNGNDVEEILDTYILNVDNSDLEFNPSEIVGGGTASGGGGSSSVVGGVSSWNDLTDRPFYEATVDLIFNGDTTGKEMHTLMPGIHYIKVSEDAIDPNTITMKEFLFYTSVNGELSVKQLDLTILNYSEGVYIILHSDLPNIPVVASVTADEAVIEGMRIGRGVYFLYANNNGATTYVNKVSYTYIKQLEEKYIELPFYDKSFYYPQMEEMVCNFGQDDSGIYAWNNMIPNGDGSYALATNFNFMEGRTYRITFDGIEYMCKAFSAMLGTQSGEGVGNMALLGGEDTGEPFLMGTDGTSHLVCFTPSSEASHTLYVELLVENIKPLPEKYLPKEAILAMIDEYISEALGGEY